jgi:MFS family permease
MGTGITNFLFAIPAIYTIDTFGRRNLLLTTFPLMGICLLWCGLSFQLPEYPAPNPADPPIPSTGRLASIAAAIYTCKYLDFARRPVLTYIQVMAVYSPGEGPVPFTYSAESFPLHLRDVGMSFATATCWGFNFILSLTWPALVAAFTPTGAFCWYAAWNFFGWIYCYFLLPETKALTLEELDTVFDVGNRQFAAYYTKKLPWYFNKKILRRDVEPMEPLFELHETGPHTDYSSEPVSGVNATQGTDIVEKDEAKRY